MTYSVFRVQLSGREQSLVKIGEYPSRAVAARKREEARTGTSELFVTYREVNGQLHFVNSCVGSGKK